MDMTCCQKKSAQLDKKTTWQLLCLFFIFFHIVWGISGVEAFNLGETYDSSNWEGLKDRVPPPVLSWVKKGEFILKTGKLNFEYKHCDEFLDSSSKNAGKFDIDEDGYLIVKKTGEIPRWCYGFPFPEGIDIEDPKAGAKIMENFGFQARRIGGIQEFDEVCWVGEGGFDRAIYVEFSSVMTQNPFYADPASNPKNILEADMAYIHKPMQFTGIVSMNLQYIDKKENTVFSYVPAMRRASRKSPASQSDPFLGSDFCQDDGNLWSGKNSSMKWKLIGQMTVLAGFTSPHLVEAMEDADGMFSQQYVEVGWGWETPGWKGAPWAPVTLTWTPRSVWVVEAMPKDPSYNYGRTLYYVDKETYAIWHKEIYDKGGNYWKMVVNVKSYQVSKSGKTNAGLTTQAYIGVDDKTHHATVLRYARLKDFPPISVMAGRFKSNYSLYIPPSRMELKNFNKTNIYKISK